MVESARKSFEDQRNEDYKTFDTMVKNLVEKFEAARKEEREEFAAIRAEGKVNFDKTRSVDYKNFEDLKAQIKREHTFQRKDDERKQKESHDITWRFTPVWN